MSKKELGVTRLIVSAIIVSTVIVGLMIIIPIYGEITKNVIEKDMTRYPARDPLEDAYEM